MTTSTFDLICACGECGVDPDTWECESARDEVAKAKARTALAGQVRKVFAYELMADGEKLAPVSGARCRGCGKNPFRVAASQVWFIERSAAWCPDCHAENQQA